MKYQEKMFINWEQKWFILVVDRYDLSYITTYAKMYVYERLTELLNNCLNGLP